jgi:hypothetical protein
MTLTAEFNFKAQIKRRTSVGATDIFGGQSLSRFFCSIDVRRRSSMELEPSIVIKPEIQRAPVLIRRGMNI